MIVYIGDISKQDAVVLKEMAEQHERILEFGSGASTQVLAAYTEGELTSIDTEKEWIRRTQKNLEFLEIKKDVRFSSLEDFKPEGEYDFIFDDGLMNLRGTFAIEHWKYLKPGGLFAFHDTRRAKNIVFLCGLLQHCFLEVEAISFNHLDSNITLIKKRKVPLVYENWNQAENKKRWQYGHGEVDMDEYNALQNEPSDIRS